jgi:hypothetical protein
MMSTRRPPYLPFLSGPALVAPRLSPIRAEDWLLPDSEAEIWLGPKRDLMHKQRDRVFAIAPGLEDDPMETPRRAMQQVAEAVSAHVPHTTGWPTPLETAAAGVSDDLCVLMRGPDGLWRLVAASVCAPTFWTLNEVIGKPLGAIHQSVPGGDPELARRISRVFDGLEEGLVLERFNWTVQAGEARYTPTSEPLKRLAERTGAAAASSVLHLRVERQTVRKLGRLDASLIVFTIRVAVDPLAPILEETGMKAAFKSAWDGTEETLAQYKGWASYDHLVRALVG